MKCMQSSSITCFMSLLHRPNTSIVLQIHEFATECMWDHLYIFDGDSADAPLLAVFRYGRH